MPATAEHAHEKVVTMELPEPTVAYTFHGGTGTSFFDVKMSWAALVTICIIIVMMKAWFMYKKARKTRNPTVQQPEYWAHFNRHVIGA